ncbi:MAG: hypothetical protein C4586_08595 [Anaerolineaceae bacterium]|nr:MAG: hypothetical protein C4586_08595 [Anaerolineaceae bacterium]
MSESKYESFSSISELKPGMIVRGKSTGQTFMVLVSFGDRVTAVSTADITNPDEWEVLKKITPS